jgi:hypothetical protein
VQKTLKFGPGEWPLSSYVEAGIGNVLIFIKEDVAQHEMMVFSARA